VPFISHCIPNPLLLLPSYPVDEAGAKSAIYDWLVWSWLHIGERPAVEECLLDIVELNCEE